MATRDQHVLYLGNSAPAGVTPIANLSEALMLAENGASITAALVSTFPEDKPSEEFITHFITALPEIPLIGIVEDQNADAAVRVIELGASDYLFASQAASDQYPALLDIILRSHPHRSARLDPNNELVLQSQKMQAIGRLAGGIAHDFNNLLTPIIGFAHLIKDEVSDNENAVSFTNEIISAGERASDMNNNLLSFSRSKPAAMMETDLHLIIRNTMKLLSRTLGSDVEVEVEQEASQSTLTGDGQQLQQIIINLGVNAREAMPSGGRLTIGTRNEEVQTHPNLDDGQYVVLAIKDTGHGIKKEDLDKIVEPFFTTKTLGEGPGLGLALVYGVVEHHNGHLQVSSSEGEGTMVEIWLPLAASAPSPIPEPTVTSEKLPEGSETILVIEDEEAPRKVARRVLESLGYTVLEASNGGEAILAMEEHQDQIALVLSDIFMPKIKGLQVVERLQKINPNFEVIYTSGHTADNLSPEDLDCSSNFLPKPYSRPKLARMVRRLLDERKLPI